MIAVADNGDTLRFDVALFFFAYVIVISTWKLPEISFNILLPIRAPTCFCSEQVVPWVLLQVVIAVLLENFTEASLKNRERERERKVEHQNTLSWRCLR